MLPLPDAHQSNLAGQPCAGLQQASDGVGLRFSAYATQVLQRSGRGVQRMFLLIAIREGGICAAGCKSTSYRLGARSKSRPWLSEQPVAWGYGCPASLPADRDSTASGGPLRCFSSQ